MTLETALLVALGLLSTLLSILLFARIRSDKRRVTGIQGMSLQEFSDFLTTNSIDGNILSIAGKVSEVLKSVCGCERLIFLRKQRGMLEMNYYYGLTGFSRPDFRAKFTPELAGLLRTTFLPQPVSSIQSVLPQPLFSRLTEFQFDRFFPIFWRDNLYGVYFLKSNSKTSDVSFEVMVASLAHSLSAAYHVRWQEARLEKMHQRQAASEAVKLTVARPRGVPNQILKLVRHRNTEAIVPRIVDVLQHELGVQRIAYFASSKDDAALPIQFKTGIAERLDSPPRQIFNSAAHDLGSAGVRSLDLLVAAYPEARPWVEQLRAAGFRYIAGFPLSGRRPGLLALDAVRQPGELTHRLASLIGPAQEMFENAHSFEQLEELSYTDNLTGLSNQRYFRKRLVEEVNRARRYRRDLALIIFDLDDLKGINDLHGHLAGDAMIRRLGPILKSSIRTIDIIARYGGDEFCVIMPEADSPTCLQFMQRLRTKIAESAFSLDDPPAEIRCTISLGGAIFPLHADTDQKLIFAADMALLKAKARGRNQYLLYSPETMVGTGPDH